jgi:hypothetical protein
VFGSGGADEITDEGSQAASRVSSVCSGARGGVEGRGVVSGASGGRRKR